MKTEKTWRDLPLWKRQKSQYSELDFQMVRVMSLPEKARVYREYQHTRKLPSGDYSIYGFQMCSPSANFRSAIDLSCGSHKVVHPFSVDVYYLTDTGELEKTYDATERATFLRALIDGEPLHARLSPFYFVPSWDGIEIEAAKDVRVKIRGPRI